MNDSLRGLRFWALLASIFFVSFTVLAFEISLTRIYSVLFRYHYAFLAVSGAVCGLGLGGLIWHLLGKSKKAAALDVGWAALGFALLIPAAIALLFGTDHLWAAFIPLLPFGFAGAFLAEVFRRWASESGRLYQADLAGAGLAAILIVPLIGLTGALLLAFLLGALAAFGAVCWAASRGKRLLLAVSIAGLAALLISWPLAAKKDLLRIRPQVAGSLEVAKPMLQDLADPAQKAGIMESDWSAYARTDLVRYDLPHGSFVFQLYTDGETPAPMVPFKGDLREISYLKSELPFFAFLLSPQESLLSIGPGGGMDFLFGTLAGFKQMEGVEINASMVQMVERHREINGDVYHLPGVKVTVDDGRSFVRRSNRQYDLIISSLTQTATTGNVGLSLVESYIHTKEAFDDYYRHLTPDGRYALITQSEPLLLRAAFTAIEVMEERGMEPSEACRHLIALSVPNAERAATPYRFLLIWKKTPFERDEIAFAQRVVNAHLADLIFLPGVGGNPLLQQIAEKRAVPREIFASGVYREGARLNLKPATDEKPFFLYLGFGVPPILIALLVGSLGAVLVYTTALLPFRRRGRGQITRWLLYFSALGAGFMLVEIPLAQKFILFLGHPTLSLAVIIFCLLIGASLGSRFSQRWALESLPRRVALTGVIIAILAIAYTLPLSRLLNLFLPWPLAARLLAAAIFLLPLGLVLGVPFPSGLRLISLSWQDEIPWMWGINGMMSVVGSALAAAGAEIIGFSGCLLCGAAIYAGLVLFLPHSRVVQAEENR
jgi:hypothetical protein